MKSTQASRREIFRMIAATSYRKWPAYHSTSLYDRSSLGGLEEDVRTVARVWFKHDAHESVEHLVCCLPLAYVEFEAHDRYSRTTRYEMEQLVRVCLLKSLHGWEHESALVEYLHQRPRLCERLGFESVPDQSTLWRTWKRRFASGLKEMISTAARTILIHAERADVPIPREPPERPFLWKQSDETAPTQQTTLNRAAEITEQVSEIVHPAFSLDRGGAVRSTRIRSGSYRPTSAFTRTSPRMRAHAASSTNLRGIELRSDITIEHDYASCRSVRSVRCTEG